MASSDTYVIVGAGHGAGQAVASLRQKGFDGRLILIGEEPFIPYQRPPLSKAFLAGDLARDRLYFKPSDFYTRNNVDLMLSTRVVNIDRSAKSVQVHDGRQVSYHKLLVMTGSRVRQLTVPGVDLPGIHYVRTIEDVEGIREHFAEGVKLVVVGGGYIGLEVAAIAAKRGLDVTVIEAEDRVMSRVVGPEISRFFTQVHTQQGVKILTGKGVKGFAGTGKIEQVVCADDTRLAADLAVIGVGILPNQELAAESGLNAENGIIVDEYCRTNDPHIFAAGDCTNHPNGIFGMRIRLESVQNALEQAKTAALAMLGDLKAYNQVPWFWSDQYDIKFQIAGLSKGYDQIVLRGDPSARKFAAFYLKDGTLLAVDAINSAHEYMVGRKLIAAKARPDPEKLTDTTLSMKQVV